jgi:hypothetical protein
MAAGLDGSDPLTVHVKMLRAELLSVKADPERELENIVLDCAVCGGPSTIGGLGAKAGHRTHAEAVRTGRRSCDVDAGGCTLTQRPRPPTQVGAALARRRTSSPIARPMKVKSTRCASIDLLRSHDR